ncbi:MAG: O-antigen ligase family protein [Candidatus Limnocylindria bacterium]
MTGTDVSERLPAPARRLSGLGLPAVGAIAAFAYLVMIGGTDFGEVLAPLRLVNAIVAGALILAFVSRLRSADRIDRLVLLAFMLFAGAALLSSFPRQSLDATLAALAYMAGLFVARGLLFRDHVRELLVRVLMVLSLAVTVVTAVGWLGVVVEWWSLMGWTASPPLGFELPAGAWAHRHDVALLVAMLYPSWWIGRPSLVRRAVAIIIGLLVLFIVLIDGSRTLWLALGTATVVVAGPFVVRRWPRRARTNWLILGAGLAMIAILVIGGVAAPIVERATSLNSLGYRGAMWGPLTGAWLEHPIGGLGPGSFPWALQTTGYFDANTWAPRHPDSILFQLLPEAGLLGLLALVSLAVALVPAIMRGPSAPARWALVAFAAAGIGANPTDFAFLVVVAIAWTAFAVPREPMSTPARERPTRRWPQYAILAALAVIGLGYASTIVASFAYANAAGSVRMGELKTADASLTAAVTLDPGMALYARQRGTARLLLGDVPAATDDLERAAVLNPSDDLTWRALALAHEASGDIDSAIVASQRAVATQRSDPSNLLVAAHLALDARRDGDALDLLSQLVQAWPQIVAAPGWEAFVTSGDLDTGDVVQAAAERHRDGEPAPRSDALLLAVVTGTPVDEELSGIARARVASLECDPEAIELLASATDAELRGAGYWEVAIRASALRGTPDDRAIGVYELLTGSSIDPDSMSDTLNPLHQSDSPVPFGVDLWGYRRIPIAWPDYDFSLPDPGAGATRWLLDPASAGRMIGIRTCR